MRRQGLAIAIVGALLGTGCFVDVSRVQDPEPVFRRARQEAESLAGRTGPARSLRVLVYDPGDHELVSVSVPMWLARKLAKEGEWDGDEEGGDKVARALRGRVSLEELERSGRGAFVEVEEENGEQVLVWLR